MMTDFILLNKLASMNSNVRQERLIHNKGIGAYGTFSLYMPMSDYTSADVFNDTERKTRVIVRFSQCFGKQGTPDTARDVRGFSVRFKTKEGDLDMISQNIPVFFIDNAEKFNDMLEAFAPDKRTNITDNNRLWRFAAKNPEALGALIELYSNAGIVKSYRGLEGYGINTFIWENACCERYMVRYKWNPVSGVKHVRKHEGEFLAGFDPESASRDLYDSIENGDYPCYELAVQLIKEQEEGKADSELKNATYEWDAIEFPFIKVGIMELDEIPENLDEEINEICFSPDNLVQGIKLSKDPLLAAMCFAHRDGGRVRRGKI